jgi:hypothetical protein
LPPGLGLGIGLLRCLHDRQGNSAEPLSVVVKQGEVETHTLLDGGLQEAFRDTIPRALVGQLCRALG